MGTRNLICVVLNGEYRVAQYCQWDGYPEGQGATVLDFLTNKMDRNRFESALKETKWITNEELTKLWKSFGADDSGLVNLTVSSAFKEVHPQLARDMGADVLEFIQESDYPITLNDSTDFAKDGIFCEWAYVVDLDKNVLEVYSGFGKEKLPESSRFGNDMNEDGYSTIGLVKSYDLIDLPDEETFVAELTPPDEDENELDSDIAFTNDDNNFEDDVKLATKDAVFAVIDRIRSGDHGDDIVSDRICNYMEANIDEFMETYEMIDK